MEMTDTLRSAIETRNVARIHSVFYTIAHEDPAFASGKYEETLKYVKNLNIDGFIEEHNGSAFASQDTWNKEYWAEVASELQDNFSQERINHLLDVGKYVYGNKRMMINEPLKPVEKDLTTETKENITEGKNDETKVKTENFFEKAADSNSGPTTSKTTKTTTSKVDDTDMWLIIVGSILIIGLLVSLFKGKK